MDDRTEERLPFGFLFTDIEGSTRLWEQFPGAMSLALARHDEILRDAVRAYDGQIYRSAGDAVQAYFPDSSRAVRAAIDAQLVLQEIDWGIPGGVRVRMAIHAAEAQQTSSGDYRSPQLRRLEATLAIAHGGQILLSDAAAASVRNTLPVGASLIELGSWQLPQLGRSAPIFQIEHEGLRSGFPALNALPASSSILQERSERFFGRQLELQELQELLDQPGNRLITLTGPGGIGKTRLAQQLAMKLQTDRGANVWFVELTGLTEAGHVISAIASTMQLRESGHTAIVDTVAQELGESEAVLVLDNFEHLLSAAASIAELLERAPLARIVATSRTPLKIRGERQFLVEPLTVPSEAFDSWEAIQASEAVQLFVDRAMTAAPAFALDRHNGEAVAAVCRKLEGLPLAIELAAPRVRVLSVEELSERLDDRLGPLSTPEAHLPDRHRAMRASIDWSYELLSAEQQWFFRQLGVPQSGFTLETLEGIFGAEFDVLELIEGLLDQNLVQRGGFQRDPDRFFLLESVRQYALEQLVAAGELDAMRARHARYFADAVLERYPDQRSIDAEAVEKFRPSLPDLTQAISWMSVHDRARALDLGEGAWRIWCVAGQQSTADHWLELVLDATRDIRTVQRVRALYGRAIAAHFMGDMARAEAYDLESLELARAIGDDRGIGDASNHMAGVAYMLRDDPAPIQLLDEAMAAYERIDDRHGIAEVLLNRAAFAMVHGRYEDVLADGMRVLDYCRAERKDALASNTFHGVAEAAYQLGRVPLATSLMIEALELNWKLEFDIFTGANLQVAAGIALDAGSPEEALLLATYVQAFARDYSAAGDLIDPFGRASEQRDRMLQALDEQTIVRLMLEGERLSTAEAVEHALAILRPLALPNEG
jgi:predicted ATPase/class 3 adenylate cyclase